MTKMNDTLFIESILQPILNSIDQFNHKNAFYIDNTYYTYHDLAKSISKIRNAISGISDKNIALIANDDLETYASIIALWLEGKAYVPLHPEQPIERCQDILEQVDMHYILDSKGTHVFENANIILTKALDFESFNLGCENKGSDEDLAYVLFTSGSTGKPKGVPITRKNLLGFVDAFWALGYQLDENDRCLQMFDLTFDLSVQSYLIPLLVGATVYTVAPQKIKYQTVFELLDEQSLTFTLMVPSIIHYLHPYMDEINAPTVKYSLFAGEALIADEVRDWSKCIPNARIDNAYGPTETTIYCTAYTYLRDSDNKELDGVIGLGKSMKGTTTIIIDENRHILPFGEKGELCLAGMQLTPGYWDNPEKNKEAFFEKDGVRFYRSGDLCSMDIDGDILYHGRIDFQVKIQGYRIELGEIEHHARQMLEGANAIAVVFTDKMGHSQLALCVEKTKENPEKLLSFLKSKVPSYMIPTYVHYEPQFPLNMNGKTDRNVLKKLVDAAISQ